MSATIREIVNEALTVVGEVAGPGVQMYEDDRMKADAIRAFNMMFKKFNWRNYLQWFVVVLDGTTGKITTNAFPQVKSFEDFLGVHRNGESYRLPVTPVQLNPYTSQFSGARASFWTSLPVTDVDYTNKKIQLYPITAQDTLNVLAKVYPLVPPATQFEWTDSFYLDKDMLVYATAFMTLSGDDLNAGAADVVRNLMEMRYRDILAAYASHPIPVVLAPDIPLSGPYTVVGGDRGYLQLNEG